jgi:Fe2+ transport system protein FeoA
VLRFFRRPSTSLRQLAVVDSTTPAATAESTRECPLAACGAGARATVVAMRCDDVQACRLRALGVCEGACVSVLDARHAMLLDVRGTRIALGKALTAGITVRPLPA